MSVLVMSWVFARSKAKLGKRLVLLALADYAHDDGTRAFPSVQSIADKALISTRQVQRILRELEQCGAITRMGTTGAGTTIWQVNMTEPEKSPDAPQRTRGRQNVGATNQAGLDPKMSPNPSRDPSAPPGDASARAQARLKISGKPVQTEAWKLTELVLASFNRQAGRKLRLLSSDGSPSEAAKRIYGRVKKYDDLTFEDHEDIIRRTLLSRWWGKDDPPIGVVYGPNVFEENITRQPPAGEAKDQALADRRQRGIEALRRLSEGGGK